MYGAVSGARRADRRAQRRRICCGSLYWLPGDRQHARVAEWQTRWLQVSVPARAWRFNSSLAHQTNVALTRVNSQGHCRLRRLAQSGTRAEGLGRSVAHPQPRCVAVPCRRRPLPAERQCLANAHDKGKAASTCRHADAPIVLLHSAQASFEKSSRFSPLRGTAWRQCRTSSSGTPPTGTSSSISPAARSETEKAASASSLKSACLAVSRRREATSSRTAATRLGTGRSIPRAIPQHFRTAPQGRGQRGP
jgi:hypothetical protein